MRSSLFDQASANRSAIFRVHSVLQMPRKFSGVRINISIKVEDLIPHSQPHGNL